MSEKCSSVEAVEVLTHDDGRTRLQADYLGQKFWYELPSDTLRMDVIGDALLLSVLTVAMRRGGQCLKIPHEFPISPALYDNLPKIQRTIQIWNPDFRILDIDATIRDRSPADGARVGLFFAGGVDSFYELASFPDLIDDLICIYGFDFHASAIDKADSRQRLGAVAQHFGKSFVAVTTNHSQFLQSLEISRLLGHGMTMAATGLLMGMAECRIASTFTVYGLEPWGSHPLLDPLFTNGATRFVHGDTTITRFAKTRKIAENPTLLEHLRVCWNSHTENCGHCSKCIRTIAALRIAGKSGPFPAIKKIGQYRKFAASTDPCWVTELVAAARDAGDQELERMLCQGLRLHDLKEGLKRLNMGLFGYRLQHLTRRFKQIKTPEKWNTRPDLD